jgi:hypothetical protein
MNEVTKATETLQRLESDLAKATDRATTLQTERRQLSFAAHSGDKAARTKLDKLNGESVTFAFEAENLRSAIEEARTKLTDTQRAAELAQRKEDARKVRELGADIKKHGPVIAAALDTLRDSFVALTGDLKAARELGCEITPSRLVELSFAEAISSALRPGGLALLDLAPPHRRHTPEDLTAGYASRATAWADTVLGNSSAEAA